MRDKILEICNGWGIALKVVPRDKRRKKKVVRGYEGNNIILLIQNSGGEWDYSNTIHEIAHWIVSTPERRKEINWGLGPSPDGFFSIETVKHSYDEEGEASLLGIAIERKLGLPWERTFRYHQWDDLMEDGKINTRTIMKIDYVKELRKLGFISRISFLPTKFVMEGPKG